MAKSGKKKNRHRKFASVKHPGLAKARKVRELMAKGMSKTEARKKAGVKPKACRTVSFKAYCS